MLVIPLEATAAATILHTWFAGVPLWAFALGITVLLTITNMFSVKNYGEFEFWFALVKVVAIVAFLAIAAAAMMGLIPGSQVSGVSKLFDHGGFMPNGFGAVLGAMLTTMFTFLGTEIVTIAAAESDNPQQQITKATNSVVWRISLFYLGSIFVVTSLVAWNDPQLAALGSYQRTLELIGIPNAKAIVDVVVLISVASCLNSALYTASRMLYSLSTRRDAMQVFNKTASNGTPQNAVLGSMVVGFMMVIANYLVPEAVFNVLLATSGAIALLVYMAIAISQLRMRQRMITRGETPAFKMWLFPWLTWAVILFIAAVLVLMAFRPDHQIEVLSTAALTGLLLLVGWVRSRLLGTDWRHSSPVLAAANAG